MLIAQIADASLRKKLEAALTDMKRRQRFGLVYEEHVPETTTLFDLPIQAGATVQRRNDPDGSRLYLVKEVDGRGKATIEPEGGALSSTRAPKSSWSSNDSGTRFSLP